MPEIRSRQTCIEDILAALIHDGSYESAVIASGDGLPVATGITFYRRRSA